MGLKSSLMVDPMHTSKQPEMTGPLKNPMMQQLNVVGERNSISSTLDENAIMKQVLDTHLPDGTEVDVKSLMQMVEELLQDITTNVASTSSVAQTDVDQPEAKYHQIDALLTSNILSHTIDRLACEMLVKLLSNTDGHTIALSLFHVVENFYWDAKLTLILAAFALAYSPDQLENSTDILEQVTTINDRFDAISKQIHSVLELSRCIFQFKELPYISSEVPAMTRALNTVPIAIYWNVRGIIACATHITCMGYEYGMSSAEIQSRELSSLDLKINHLLEFLRKQLDEYNRFIAIKDMDLTESFNQVLDTVHSDNLKILKILLNPWDNPLPLFAGTTKQRVNLEVLRKRIVLLLISGLDMSLEEVSILEQIYIEMRSHGSRAESQYEVVWVSIVDPHIMNTDAMNARFEEMRNNMPWYSVYDPSNVDKAVKRSIRDRWHFRNKPILVALDPQGKEVSLIALHMMWIWGSIAFPFTTAREEALWSEETWRLELLVDGVDPDILMWTREDKYILLHGGDDIEWIRKFTRSARAMASVARIPLEMFYVGKSKPRENVRRVMATISLEKLSHSVMHPTLIWYFWTRIESMLFSKIQLKHADDQDAIMLQIKKLLSYDKDGSWGLLCHGSHILTNGHGPTMLQTCVDFDLWKQHIPSRGFDLSFKNYHDKLHGETNNCFKFEFPIVEGSIPEGMRCPECHRSMEKHISFICCHDQTSLPLS
ncbi:hypothetical protein QVD17_06756 [Tagetes erecta]|uniref:Sieve element occlusion n=1 Tax=Tagetes erecta TaxID=13708 RepID=A0AAD8LME2_TARER|nr:hypothetical protein QVD17_06756 [Tagetes erecta]